MQNDRVTIESDLIDLLTEQDEYNEKLEKSNNTIHILEEALKNARINGDARIRALVEACIKSSEKLVIRAAAEHDVAVATGTSAYFMLFGEELTGLLNELAMVHCNYVTDNYNNVEALARKCILMGHLMATVYIQGVTICKTSANIESGESEYSKVYNNIWHLGHEIAQQLIFIRQELWAKSKIGTQMPWSCFLRCNRPKSLQLFTVKLTR